MQTGVRPVRCRAQSGCPRPPGLLLWALLRLQLKPAEAVGFLSWQTSALSLLNQLLSKPEHSLWSSVEIGALQPQVWAGLPSACPNPIALWWAESAPQERGFPLDGPALHPPLHCWPWPAPWPQLENRHSPLCQARRGKGRAAAARARSPSQGTTSRAHGMTGAAEGPGPRPRDPGARRGWDGVTWRSREEPGGSLSPALPGCESPRES